MNRSSFAFLVALLIHLVLLLFFWILGITLKDIEPTKKPQEEEKKIKISLKEMPIKYKERGLEKQEPKPSIIAPPMPKGSQLKKITAKPPVKYEPHKPAVEPTLNKKKTVVAKTKPFIPLLEKKTPTIDMNKTITLKNENEKKSIFDILSEDVSYKDATQQKPTTKLAQSINQNIQELYGDEFGKLSAGQQQYILDNQEIMRRITQEVLTRVARVNIPRDLNVNRSNVIEFYLHPNGDISDIKFLQKSDIYILDDTTKETIEYAYSRYPRPSEKTLIRYNVFYNLARY